VVRCLSSSPPPLATSLLGAPGGTLPPLLPPRAGETVACSQFQTPPTSARGQDSRMQNTTVSTIPLGGLPASADSFADISQPPYGMMSLTQHRGGASEWTQLWTEHGGPVRSQRCGCHRASPASPGARVDPLAREREREREKRGGGCRGCGRVGLS
jgi:hypothetical protein